MDATHIETEYRRLKAQFDAGDLTEADFRARLQDLMTQDEQGRWWVIGYETGQWYWHDGQEWVPGEPSQIDERRQQVSTVSEEATAAPTTGQLDPAVNAAVSPPITGMTAATSAAAPETRQSPWWLTLIAGVCALVVGSMLLRGTWAAQVTTWLVLVQLLGVYWLVIGILDLVHMFRDHTAWAWKLISGIISIIAGGFILMYPVASALALPRIFVLVLGIWGLVQGILMLTMAFKGGGLGAGVLGVLGIVFCLALMVNYNWPGMGLSMLYLGAVAGVIGGIIMIWHAATQRRWVDIT